MKKNLFLLLLVSNICFSQDPPYGMIEIEDSVYIDDLEVTVGEWLEFVLSQPKEPITYGTINIDTSLLPIKAKINGFDFGLIYDYSEGFSLIKDRSVFASNHLLISSKAFSKIKKDSIIKILNYPVVGITYQQAFKYCQFMEKIQRNLFQIDYQFSIPSKSLYDYIKRNENNLTKFSNRKRVQKYNSIDTSGVIKPVDQGFPNNFGAYSLWDNVEEMTLETGVKISRKGSGFYFNNYQDPEQILGFRCSCSLKKQ